MLRHLIDQLMWWAGVTDANGPAYLFWSGIFPNLTVAVAVALWLAHHNCHSYGCWRITRLSHDGVPWCARHHPHKELLHHRRHGTQPPAQVQESQLPE